MKTYGDYVEIDLIIRIKGQKYDYAKEPLNQTVKEIVILREIKENSITAPEAIKKLTEFII